MGLEQRDGFLSGTHSRVSPGTSSSGVVDPEAARVRVGLIGLTLDSTRPEYVRFEDPIATAHDRVRKLRSRAM